MCRPGYPSAAASGVTRRWWLRPHPPSLRASFLAMTPESLPVRAADHFHQFRDFFPLIGFVAACDRMLDAVGDVIPQYLLLDAPERGADGGNLRHDVDAVAVLIDHLREAADLALDPAEAFLNGSLDVLAHGPYI